MTDSRFYFISNSHRQKVHINSNNIDGIRVKSIDEYLLNFPQCKKLVHEYMKKTRVQVDITYLHSLFANQLSPDWYKSEAIENDPVAKTVVSKLVFDPYTWKFGVREVQNTIFDAKYLLLQDKRQIAKKCIDIYMKAQNTHVISHRTTLRSFANRDKHNQFFIDRLALTKDFFESTILAETNFPNTLHINYMYDFIELHDEKSTMTLRCTVREDMNNSIKLIYPHSSTTRKRSTTNALSIMSFTRRYPDVTKVMDNINLSAEKILRYHQALRELKQQYEYTYKQCVASIQWVLDEYRAQTNYLNISRLGIVSVHPHAAETAWLTFHGDTHRINLFKTTYYSKNNQAKDNEEDWLRVTARLQSQSGYESTEDVAEYLFNQGFMNVFYIKREPMMAEYLLLANECIPHRHVMMFMMSTASEGQYLLQPYLDAQETNINDYETMCESGIELEHTLPNEKDLNDEELWSRLEIEFKRHWPHEYELSRKEMIKSLKRSSTAFARKYKKLIEH